MLGSEIVTSVRRALQDTSFSEAAILEAANWWQDEVFTANKYRKMEKSSPVATALAGATTIAFPTDMKDMIVWYQTSPQVLDLSDMFIPYEDFMKQYANFATATASPIRAWTQFGSGIRLSAPLDTDVDYYFDYVRTPVKMATTAATSEIPDGYDQLNVKGTLIKIMEANEDYQEASVERTNLAPLWTTFIANEGRGMFKTGPVIMRSNRRSTSNDWR